MDLQHLWVLLSAKFAITIPSSPRDLCCWLRGGCHGFTFPYLYDEAQTAARDFDAVCAPDFFVFDAQGKLAYRGQFDDSRPSNQLPVTGVDLRAAVDALLAGTAPSPDQKASIGCGIKWKK
ncbi:MAG TPA: hypothetical protein VFS20_29485 [Longimicrobium sp.]|nr:hypothetical protein [Longimicrobium sp.]